MMRREDHAATAPPSLCQLRTVFGLSARPRAGAAAAQAAVARVGDLERIEPGELADLVGHVARTRRARPRGRQSG
jgi:hypothetical protein